MGLGNPSRNRKTQSRSPPVTRGIQLNETVEDATLIGGWNAGPRVAYPHCPHIAARPPRERSTNDSACGVLHGVLQEVHDELTKELLVSPERDFRGSPMATPRSAARTSTARRRSAMTSSRSRCTGLRG